MTDEDRQWLDLSEDARKWCMGYCAVMTKDLGMLVKHHTEFTEDMLFYYPLPSYLTKEQFVKTNACTENRPTEITREDIDRFFSSYGDGFSKPMKMTYCTSCSKEMPSMQTDYYTGQCQECFCSRKPWLRASPVRDTYFMIFKKDNEDI